MEVKVQPHLISLNIIASMCAKKEADATTAKTTAAHLEHLSDLTIDAVNNRDFSKDSPGWSFMAPAFTFNVLYDTNNVYGDQGAQSLINLDEHLERFKHMTTEYPEWRLKLISQHTEVDQKCGRAEIFHVLEVTGHPPGIMTHTVLLLDFRFHEGRWWCMKKRAARGVEME